MSVLEKSFPPAPLLKGRGFGRGTARGFEPTFYEPCDLGLAPPLFCASVSSSVT